MSGDATEPPDLPPPVVPPADPPRLPADEVATRNVPLGDVPLDDRPRLPADEVATRNVPLRDVPLDDRPRLPADEVATRNVPLGDLTADPAAERRVERLRGDHLPTRNVPPPPVIAAAAPEVTSEFVLPELEPVGQATTALLIGRALLAVAALLVGLAARRSVGPGGQERAEAFWPVVMSAGVLTLVGVVGFVFWAMTVAGNARRLRTRSVSAITMGWSWLLPIGWVAFSALTYLRVDVVAEVDPLPGVAAVGWLITLTIPYGRLQGVFRGLSRRPPNLWITAYPLDLFAIGMLWWRLTGWPSPIGPHVGAVDTTANVAFAAAGALAANVFVYAWLAQRASSGMYERLGRLEALHDPDAGREPEWFRIGAIARPGARPEATGRPLIATKRLATAVAVLHVVWGGLVVLSSVLVAALTIRYTGEPVFEGDDLVVDDADVDRVVLIGVLAGLAYVAALSSHGVWAVLTAINARRVTVHSPNPGTFVIAFGASPLLLVVGLVIGGAAGYLLVAVALTVGFAAMIVLNQMLVALSARVGGQLLGFSRWTLCLVGVWVAGVVMNLLFSQAAAQLGVYAFLSLVQGSLVVAGGVVGYSAMQTLDDELHQHRRVHRADSG